MSFRPRSCLLCPLVATLALLPAARAIDPTPVTFETFDHVAIAGDYYAPKPGAHGAPMVILLHEYRSDRTVWKPLIGPLHEAGFATLAIDLRGHGESVSGELRERVAQRDTAVFEAMHNDVRGAYDWLARQEGVDRSRFALVGASVGSSVSLRYAVKDRSVDAIVCLSPGVNYLGLDSKRDIARIRGRRLWLIAADDPEEKRGVLALERLAENAESKLYPHGGHGTRMFGKVPHLEQQLVDYLARQVGPATDSTVYGSINSDIYHLPGSGWIDRINPSNMRHYSSPREAEARGLRKARSRGPDDKPRGRRDD